MSASRAMRVWTMRTMALGLLVTAVATVVTGFPGAAPSLLKTNGQVIAFVGEAAPGLPGVTFGNTSPFDIPSVAEGGVYFFRGRLIGTGVTALNERALYTGTTAANLAMLIRSQDPAPGLPGLTLNTATAAGPANQYRISPDGRTFWGSSLAGAGVTTTSDTALFAGPPGGLVLVAREGDPAPGTAGAVYSGNMSPPTAQITGINRQGRVIFQSALSGGDVVGTTNNAAWFTGTPGAITLMTRKGQTMLGTGETAAALLFTSHMDNNGRVLYDLTLGAPATTANDNSLWLYTPGSGSTLLVREGQSAPGTAGATFNSAANSWAVNTGPASFTRTGYYMLLADLLNGDVSGTTNNQALYRGDVASGLTMVYRKGGAAPGTDAFFNATSNTGFFVNASGNVAFQATLTGGTSTASNNSGIWYGQPGSLQLIARAGDPAPGTAGALLGGL